MELPSSLSPYCRMRFLIYVFGLASYFCFMFFFFSFVDFALDNICMWANMFLFLTILVVETCLMTQAYKKKKRRKKERD